MSGQKLPTIDEAYYHEDWGDPSEALRARDRREEELRRLGYRVDWWNAPGVFVLHASLPGKPERIAP